MDRYVVLVSSSVINNANNAENDLSVHLVFKNLTIQFSVSFTM